MSEPTSQDLPSGGGNRHLGTVDAVDEGIARIALDGGGVCTLPSRLLPAGTGEGARISLALEPDPAGTASARQELQARRARLTAGDDGGDIEL